MTFIYCASFYVYSSIQNSITNLRRMSIIHHLLKTFIQIDIQDLSPSRKTLMISLSFFPFLFPFLVALSNFGIFFQVSFEKSSDNNFSQVDLSSHFNWHWMQFGSHWLIITFMDDNITISCWYWSLNPCGELKIVHRMIFNNLFYVNFNYISGGLKYS